MGHKWKSVIVALLVVVAVTGFVFIWKREAGDDPAAPPRDALTEKAKDGNYKDAYDGLRKLALDPHTDPRKVGEDLAQAVYCLKALGRIDEADEFREAVIAVHPKNWRLLQEAARSYALEQNHGFIIAGKFQRGWHKGGGRYVSTQARDRVRALQLMQQAVELTRNDTDRPAVAQFHLLFAALMRGDYHRRWHSSSSPSWQLLVLTDLSKLPDYEDGDFSPGGSGAPVNEQGNPVFHDLPKSYETAQNDGERWRWLLARAAELDPRLANDVDMTFARFLLDEFGVQTLDDLRSQDDDEAGKAGVFALHTLADDETIARLAGGVKRFKLPDRFNCIRIFERVAGRPAAKNDKTEPAGSQALANLAQIYLDRRQNAKAAAIWKRAIAEYGPGEKNYRQHHLDQIVGNWCRFESAGQQAAGKNATVNLRFRNGDKVSFEAVEIKVAKLLGDAKAYFKSNPASIDSRRADIRDIGHRLVEQQQTEYLGNKVAAWDMELKPRTGHADRSVTITAPLKKPGAYLLTATMANGNTSRIIVWISDTVIVQKRLQNKVYYFVADAVTGEPVPSARFEFFGYQQVQVKPNAYEYKVVTKEFSKTGDKDGQLIVDVAEQTGEATWLVTAKAEGERFAYLGFSHLWFRDGSEDPYDQVRVFAITDRPVYRPEQKVQFKLWVRHAKYDQPDTSDFAGKQFKVRIDNPKREKVFEQELTADAYGGLVGEYALPRGAGLGSYLLYIDQPDKENRFRDMGHFRVEEYKKPEFEVTVEAPKEPVKLGDKITATIQAKYFFGAAVTHARVKYKVTRTNHTSHWYPGGDWDWLYGRGYWWFAGEYLWYPGWGDWGCARPGWGSSSRERPELVIENEVPIGPDGTVKVDIDTLPAKELHGDQDHKYSITAEVVDESRRTIVGAGEVLVARKPFKVYAWVDRGHYRAGDTILASFSAQTLDQQPVPGAGELTLFQITYDEKSEPVEKALETWKLDTNERGTAEQKLKAAQPGQYRLSYSLTDAKKHTIEGAYLFVVAGQGFTGKDFRFNDLELVADRREYRPGDKIKLLVNTNRARSVVLLFTRPISTRYGYSTYQLPKILRLEGKSVEEEIAVVQRDMPNFFVEAVTIADGRVHTEVREITVPPEKRILNVEVAPSQPEYKPGQKATVRIKLTDFDGKPFQGSTVVSIYDKSVEYISGGSNVPEIKEFFWKWRRNHQAAMESSLAGEFGSLHRRGEASMSDLGIFGGQVPQRRVVWGKDIATLGLIGDEDQRRAGFGGELKDAKSPASDKKEEAKKDGSPPPPAKSPPVESKSKEHVLEERDKGKETGQPPLMQPTIRKNFADTAFWSAAITTDKDGAGEVSLTMPENLTAWKIRVWGMGHGTRVGEGDAVVTTKKDLIVRLQAPRFFVQKDEVVLSANVHNYLKKEKEVHVSLELAGGALISAEKLTQIVTIPAGGEKRVDWLVKVQNEGDAVIRMKAQTDDDADAMEMRFPCHVHGILKTDSYTGVIRADQAGPGTDVFDIPAERRVNQTMLEVRYSPTLAGAMIDALPYLVKYPYGCTEQTLNRFLPTVITQRLLQDMKLDLKEIQKHQTNLNAQEIGDDKERIAKGWHRWKRNPVFDEAEVANMANSGVQALANMQLSDGGWGWFSGHGEHSYPHTTATVVHGLLLAKQSKVALPEGMLERGLDWLKNYQAQQVTMLQNAARKTTPWKEHGDNLDALVFMVLSDAEAPNNDMRDFLYRDRTHIGVYAKAMFGLALFKQQQQEKLDMILKNIEQYVVQDEENQTAYLRLPPSESWWYWYGSETEANAYYLKLLARTAPKDQRASRLVKYLLNNRRHSTYWNSTRDTALCIEALADYLKASGEDRPDMNIEVWLDGKKHKDVHIDAKNLFSFDNRLVLVGDAVTSGKHTLQIKRTGAGPVYWNAYVTNFTLEDFITKAGLEVRVNRKYFKLTRVDHAVKTPGSKSQPLEQKVEKYERLELPNLAELKSGDLVEIELEIDSKNDYEYLLFEDPKAAGFEPMQLRSGYEHSGLGAYMEVRDDKISFFVRQLPRGKHSISYRMRAEIPGQFSALPTQASAMYAPELKGNSDEIKLRIRD